MKRLLSFFAALALAFSLSTGLFAAREEETVHIDLDDTYQTIDGFGASYTWYLGWAVNHNESETIWDWVFNETEFNILRFRDLNEIRNEDEAQMARDGYPEYCAVYQAALARGIEPTVLVTSWGEYRRDLPFVAFTEKADNGFTYYTLAKNADGEYMYDELADFCVQSVRYFFDAGIPVDYFSISNEAEFQERGTDENGNARAEAGFFLGADENEYHAAYWKAYIAVYEAFKEAFGEFAPVLIGAETMAAYPDLLKSYIDPIAENCPESLSVVGHHLYGTDLSERNLRAVGEAMSGYTIWQTELYNNDCFAHSETVLDELVYEGVSAYLYWNGVWDFDMGNCLIEVGYQPDSMITRMNNHYALQHFSKYIKKGYKRVGVSEELKSKFGAFKSPDGSKLTVVAINRSNEDEYMTLDLGGKEILGSKVILSVEGENRFSHEFLTDMGEYEDELLLPAGGLMTIVLDLEPDPDYVEPVVEKKENPFVKKPSGVNVLAIVIAAVAVVVVAAIALSAVIVIKNMKKLAAKEKEDNQ